MQLRNAEKVDVEKSKSRKFFAKGLNELSAGELEEAYFAFTDAAKNQESIGIKKWVADDYRFLMDVYTQLLDLLESGELQYAEVAGDSRARHLEKVRLANSAKIKEISIKAREYFSSASIKSFDFELSCLRIALLKSGHGWRDPVIDNDAVPEMLPPHLEGIADRLANLCIAEDRVDKDEAVNNSRTRLIARCYLQIASGYMRLANTYLAVSYYIKALEQVMRVTQKDSRYLEIIYVAFNNMHHHVQWHCDYPVISFARRIFSQPSIFNPTFLNLNNSFQEWMSTNASISTECLELWQLIFDILQERLEAGAFTKNGKGKYLAEFSDSDFRVAMEHRYYREQFAEMRERFKNRKAELLGPATPTQRGTRPPELDEFETPRERTYPESMILGLLMNSRIFESRIKRNLSEEWDGSLLQKEKIVEAVDAGETKKPKI